MLRYKARASQIKISYPGDGVSISLINNLSRQEENQSIQVRRTSLQEGFIARVIGLSVHLLFL